MFPLFYFTKEHFLIVNYYDKLYAYFPGLDLNIYRIDLEKLDNTRYAVDKQLLERFFQFRYKDLDSYFKDYSKLMEHFRNKYKNKEVIIGFTGGKDSVVLALALEKLGIKYKTVYTHIPYFEELLYFFSKDIFERFNVDMVEIPKAIVKDVLSKGPPYVKCPLRALKMKAIRLYLKSKGLSRNAMITGERVFESPNRYSTLVNKIHNPIQFLTDLETYHIAKVNNALSRIYLINNRASCIPCSRASTLMWFVGYENLMLFDYEGFELLDKALEIDYNRKRKYLDSISLEQFKYLGLHRINPLNLKEEIQNLEKLSEEAKEVSKSEIFRIFREFYKKI